MMFSDWQNQVLGDKFPFDVQVYSADVNDDFQDELKIIGKESDIEDAFIYTSMQARPIRQTRGCIRICKYSGTLI